MQLQPCTGQRRQSVVGQRGAHCGAVVTHDLRFLIVLATLLRLALDRPDAAHALLQLLLRMAIGLGDWLGRLAEVVEMAQLMGDLPESLLHRVANALLAVGDHTSDGYGQGRADLGDQPCQILGRGR